jgi:hypothetical protein
VASFSGDMGKIARWSSAISKLDSLGFRFQVADTLSDVSLGLVAEGFARETDPFGRRWAPKKRPDGRRILRGETNRLVQFRKAFVNQHGYRIESRAPYGHYHQTGTSRMVARKMTPDGRLPPRWASELRSAAIAMTHRLLKSG